MTDPKLPVTNSPESAVLAYLSTGKRMSQLSFQGDTSSYCFHAPTINLKGTGFPIDAYWNTRGISRVSGRCTRYIISDENLIALRLLFGKRLEKFIEAVKRIDAKAA